MSSESPVSVDDVQQQIAAVVRKVSDMEARLAVATQAEDATFLRNLLITENKKEAALREEQNLLLQAYHGGGHCSVLHHLLISSCVTSTICNMLLSV